MPPGQVRIIGGRWRSRRLEFPAMPGLRPTPDRVRETVFNWLAPVLPGATCLDLFAGSGAFGFECLSRGAARAVLVEAELAAVAALQHNRDRLAAESAAIVHAAVQDYLRGPARGFDVVFLDPPYASGLQESCLQLLGASDWLKPGGYLYLEAPAGEPPALPAGWQRVHGKTTGQVGYHLLRRIPNPEPA